MQKVTTVKALRQVIQQWRSQGDRIAFVPTMGNLHAGHIKLVSEAKTTSDRVVVSIFVNPTQFGEGEDFGSYPRTAVEDEAKLTAAATDLLFLPTVDEMYPGNSNTVVSVVELSTYHCGATRAGHFDGVATIVTKLFNMVQPDVAAFGEKDFQQLVLIRTMVQDLNIPVQVFGVATERETDGLAMSSRNGYLTKQQRLIAPELYKALCKAREAVLSNKLSLRAIEQRQQNHLQALGFDVDYFSICRSNDLQQAQRHDNEVVILAAAKLGKPRLIDNVCLSNVHEITSTVR
ncbi:MAG: pantoate--beta-alanine ligase [Methylococcaceae bacterium]